MSSKACILPPNSSQLERKLAQVGADVESVDVDVIARFTRVDTAPSDFLPYLAWEVSVDRWSDEWSDTTKRQVIRDAFYVHKRKGTIASLRRVVEPFGYLLQVIEWFQELPPARRGTFKLDIGVNENGITDDVYMELERLIDETKPLSRHMTGLSITLLTRGTSYMGCAAYLGDELTVYPPESKTIHVTSTGGAIGGIHLVDILTVSSK